MVGKGATGEAKQGIPEMIKLLALDLDGTLLNSRGEISQANREAISAAENAGVLVTIATGRRYRDARPVGLKLELNAPLVTHNGALVKYARSLETVGATLLDIEATREIVRVGKQYGGDALVSTDPHGKGSMLYDRVSDDNIPLQKYLAWAARMHGAEAHDAVAHVEDLHDALPDHQVIHISFSGPCEPMQSMLDTLRRELSTEVTILPTVYPRMDFTLIDILPPGVSKGSGVGTIAALNAIARSEVMVIGDNYNDLDMLEFAGQPVIMGNADPGLLERQEFYTTLSNDENGVADAIRRFILEKESF